jgi:hypothetical protein
MFKFGLIGVFIQLAILCAIGIGWSMNLYKLTQADFEAPYKTEIIRVAGLFPLIGMVTGHMTIGEENDAVIVVEDK